jgi:hypothetical protein
MYTTDSKTNLLYYCRIGIAFLPAVGQNIFLKCSIISKTLILQKKNTTEKEKHAQIKPEVHYYTF